MALSTCISFTLMYVWVVMYLAKCFTNFPLKMEEAKMMPHPVSLILIIAKACSSSSSSSSQDSNSND